MNYIWCLMVIVSIVVSVFTGTVSETINGAFEGAKSAVFTALSFAGIMCFWTGIMKIAEKSGLSERLEGLLTPLIKFLFPGSGDKARKYIAVNLSANILGMGNAATPMGIKAMDALDGENENPLYASKNMCMLVVLNTASVQLIPTTVIALRSAAGSTDPFSVLPSVWISSLTAAVIAVTLTKLFYRSKQL